MPKAAGGGSSRSPRVRSLHRRPVPDSSGSRRRECVRATERSATGPAAPPPPRRGRSGRGERTHRSRAMRPRPEPAGRAGGATAPPLPARRPPSRQTAAPCRRRRFRPAADDRAPRRRRESPAPAPRRSASPARGLRSTPARGDTQPGRSPLRTPRAARRAGPPRVRPRQPRWHEGRNEATGSIPCPREAAIAPRRGREDSRPADVLQARPPVIGRCPDIWRRSPADGSPRRSTRWRREPPARQEPRAPSAPAPAVVVPRTPSRPRSSGSASWPDHEETDKEYGSEKQLRLEQEHGDQPPNPAPAYGAVRQTGLNLPRVVIASG